MLMATVQAKNNNKHSSSLMASSFKVFDAEITVPAHFRCPISLELMKDPVATSSGITYDRSSIEAWLETGGRTCPVTGTEINPDEELIPNHVLRRMIQNWCVANKSLGIERIPTPRVPITISQASDILASIESASRISNSRMKELIKKMKALVRESDRNRKHFVSAGAAKVLAACFSVTGDSSVLSAMATVVPPLDEEACRNLMSPGTLNSVVTMLSSGDLESRHYAGLVLKELFSSYDKCIDIDDKQLINALVKLIKEPICPQATKAALATIFYIISFNEATASLFAEAGLVPLLLELLVEDEKSSSQRGLAVFSELLNCERGRKAAYEHALTVPVLVKKMFRVSDTATELVVSSLWRLLKSSSTKAASEGVGLADEALQLGAFQKLLLLLQVGCSKDTKEKATQVLKMLNGSMGKWECFEPNREFKVFRRPLKQTIISQK